MIYPIGLSMSKEAIKKPDSYFEEMKANGITWCEVSCCYDCTVQDSIDLAERLLAAGMRLWSIHVPFGKEFDIASPDEAVRAEAVELMKPYFPLAAKYGIRKAVVHPSWEPIADEERAAHIAAFKKSLPDLCDAAQAEGVTLCIENIPRSCLANTSWEMKDMLSADPRARIVLDTNHMLQQQAHDFAADVADLVESLHISDYDMTNEKHWLPGEGITQYDKLFAALRAAGYNGVYMMELGDHKDGTPYTIKEAADALKKVL